MGEEVWKIAYGFPGYLVSSEGRVASIMVVSQKTNKGHRVAQLIEGEYKGRKNKGRLPKKVVGVHRLVLSTFDRPPREGEVCRHLNDVAGDDRAENLAWGSKRDNAEDARANGRLAVGSRAGGSKLSEAQATEVRRRYIAGEPPRSIAADFGIHEVHAAAIGRGRFWRHLPHAAGTETYLKGSE